MNNKKSILIFIDWFLPGFKAGGPIQSIANLIEHCSSIFDFTIITSDRDLGDQTPYPETLNTFIQKEGYKIIFLSPEKQNKPYLEQIISGLSFDVVYFNSFFSKAFTIIPLGIFNKKYKSTITIVAPRGMLGQGALNIKKAKKKIFISGSKLTGLYKNVRWHATTNEEQADIYKLFPKSKAIIIAENIGKKQAVFIPRIKNSNELKLVFISRIALKKNLLFAIQTLSELKFNGHIIFDIFGPIEAEDYWEQCLAEAEKLPKKIQFSYKGELNPNAISATFSQYHFFFFPTLHENFGHVIFESLAAGCPVILSKNTPWRNLKEKNIGVDIALDKPQEFSSSILDFLTLSNTAYQAMSNAAYGYITNNTNSQLAINQYLKLFDDE